MKFQKHDLWCWPFEIKGSSGWQKAMLKVPQAWKIFPARNISNHGTKNNLRHSSCRQKINAFFLLYLAKQIKQQWERLLLQNMMEIGFYLVLSFSQIFLIFPKFFQLFAICLAEKSEEKIRKLSENFRKFPKKWKFSNKKSLKPIFPPYFCQQILTAFTLLLQYFWVLVDMKVAQLSRLWSLDVHPEGAWHAPWSQLWHPWALFWDVSWCLAETPGSAFSSEWALMTQHPHCHCLLHTLLLQGAHGYQSRHLKRCWKKTC